MSKPLTLSIVIPVYNEEEHLRACLDSIAAQTTKPDEVIVVDNNSTDKSLVIAESCSFVGILHEKSQGVVFARNTGFDAASSDIIGRIDADTVLPTDWVAWVQNFYKDGKNQKAALTGGGFFYNLPLKRLNGWGQSQLAYRTNRLILGFYILWGSNMALPNTLWKEVRLDTCKRNDIHEDLDLAIHLHRRGYHIAYRAGLRVGVYMKRFHENRNQQHEHLARWPQTLRSHGYRNWWLGSLGNFLIVYILQPIAIVAEFGSKLMGHRSK